MEKVYAVIKPFWYDETKKWEVVRITKKWIVVKYNDAATGKYNRKDGYCAGAFMDRASTPDKIINLDELNNLANDNGGIWEYKKEKK